MAIFWSNPLLGAGFVPDAAEERRAGSQNDRDRSDEDEAPSEAGQAGDSPDQGRPGQEAEVAEDRHSRERGASTSFASEATGHAVEGRGGERETPARDAE